MDVDLDGDRATGLQAGHAGTNAKLFRGRSLDLNEEKTAFIRVILFNTIFFGEFQKCRLIKYLIQTPRTAQSCKNVEETSKS